SQGVAPFSPTLSFSVSDADGDATRCSIDVGGDGTVEFASFPCAQGSQAISITAVGPTNVVLTATDGAGGSASKTLQLTGAQPAAEIRISRVEWGQSVVSESPRLVEGKAALLRVHVLADRAGLGGITVDAEVRTSAGAVLGR